MLRVCAIDAICMTALHITFVAPMLMKIAYRHSYLKKAMRDTVRVLTAQLRHRAFLYASAPATETTKTYEKAMGILNRDGQC